MKLCVGVQRYSNVVAYSQMVSVKMPLHNEGSQSYTPCNLGRLYCFYAGPRGGNEEVRGHQQSAIRLDQEH